MKVYDYRVKEFRSDRAGMLEMWQWLDGTGAAGYRLCYVIAGSEPGWLYACMERECANAAVTKLSSASTRRAE